MAFGDKKSSGGSVEATNIKYSRILGQLYVDSDEARAFMDTIPDSTKREGFNDKTASQFRRDATKAGIITSSSLDGKLNYVALRSGKDKKGIEREYISVGVVSEVVESVGSDETKKSSLFLSLPLKSKEGLAVIHRLVNAKFGEDISLKMFGTMGEPKEDGTRYANHVVSMKQDGEKVEPVFTVTLDELNAKRKEMKADGDDNESIGKALMNMEVKATRGQIDQILKAYEAYHEERKAAKEELPNEAAEQAEQAGQAPSAEDFDDDIPF